MRTNLVILLLCGWMMVAAGTVRATYQDDLNGGWNYKKIFSPSEIPIPDSAKDLGAWNRAVYSPSVIKVNETYFMLFGVSIYCQGGRVARDSVAIARSTDGIDWQFWKYLIEADARACKQSRNEWTDDEENPFTYQVNDPAAYFNPNNTQEILVFYTTVKNYQDNFGHIGLAKFDKSWNLKFRNDYFIEGSRALGGPGYSRPTVNWKENGGPRLYFDSTFTGINKIGSIRLDNLDQLKNPEVRDERTGGIDIEIQELRLGEVLLLSGGIWARERRLGGEWGPLFYPIPLSGEAWDKDGQGSPPSFFE